MERRRLCSRSFNAPLCRPWGNAHRHERTAGLFRQFARDQSGSYVIISALLMPVLVGTAGLGTEVGWWYYKHKNMQSAADSGAVSAATAASAGTDLLSEANAVTANYGYTNAVNNVTVTVNQPPKTGNFTSNPQAVEVIVSQPQPRLLSALFGSDPVLITARAVALPNSGTGCVLALNASASPAVNVSGGNQLNLIKCNLYSNSSASPSLNVAGSASVSANQVGVVGDVSGASSITATNGIKTHILAVADPYANVSPPSEPSCDNKKYTINANGKTNSLDPGCYSGSITVNAGATLNLNPGNLNPAIYYLDGANLSVAGNATITGNNVTLVFTGSGSNWGTASIGSNATINLTAPTTGSTKGIVMYGDRNMPAGTAFNLTGGSTQNFGGAIYLPKANLSFSGGNGTSTSCTKIIADTLTFSGTSNLQVNCTALGTATIGSQTAQLIE
ncbi:MULTISPECIES: pilus assembly protein TadG-related protein [unclassified Bradyrhizobium]|uniref:pilus assembly protein TadG-related protein n=1 Tax=unclassified Bradyrhizobium TaxID=2631580 RepID=UPI0024799AD9|nr:MULTISPECIES: pilus assembly protein TadG-related protein [unclassified Bradyrhizobium]WGR72486.1 pilus assembly protein TadG-related protein [Bradyrhizobium sp. ISRA426]WGR77319.1 pilus assembly protein TadG-related protein [Bradyrhizobium sp. ISRA430]WGR87725.1 pilus assembly protein TadG-related protein [Bradyrhizobium sp. ISRA432]